MFSACNSHESDQVADHDSHNHELEEGHDHKNEGHDHEHPGNAGEAHAGEIVFPAEKAKAAGIATAMVEASSFSEVIPTSGRILPAAGDVTTVAATRSGIVRLLRPWSLGMNVAAGTPLFSISASKLPEGEPGAKARSDYAKAKADYERAESLWKERLISASEYQEAKRNYENADILYKSVGRDSEGGATVNAQSGGYITDCLVANGEYVEVGRPLMTLSANRHLRLQADLPQREYSRIGSIRSANIRLSQSETSISLKDLNGRLISRGHASSGAGAYIPIIFEFDNSAGVPAGVFTEVYLLGSPREGVIAIPKSALIEEQGLFYVYIRKDEDCYSKRNVKIGKTDGIRVEVTDGLKEGETIVTEGAMHVKLASASTSIPGHTHNH